MSTVAENVASHLLKIKAIKLEPAHPFTWASGWKSPIYCDNRKTLSFPGVRSYIKEQFAAVIREKYPQAEVIAGVAGSNFIALIFNKCEATFSATVLIFIIFVGLKYYLQDLFWYKCIKYFLKKAFLG